MGVPYTCRDGFVTKNRGTWIAVIPFYNKDGVRETKSRSTGVACDPERDSNRGKNKAREFLAQWRDAFARELLEASEKESSSNMRFVDFAERYLSELDNTELAEQTLLKYRSYLKCIRALEQSCDSLHSKAIWDATLQDLIDDGNIIHSFYQALYSKGLSSCTVGHYMSFCRLVYSAACARRLVKTNPFHEKQNKPPRPRKRPVNYLVPEDLLRVVEIISHRDRDAFRTSVIICINTGMRRSEICGLRWADIDFDRNLIHVRGALTKAKKGSAREFKWSVPKNDASIREVPISRALRAYLLSLRAEVISLKADLGIQWDSMDYVTGDVVSGGYFSPSRLTDMWKAFSELIALKGVLGSRPVFHDLRHTFAVIAIASGMDIETLAKILGHEKPSMTLDIYGDALASAKQQAIVDYESYMNGFAPNAEEFDRFVFPTGTAA